MVGSEEFRNIFRYPLCMDVASYLLYYSWGWIFISSEKVKWHRSGLRNKNRGMENHKILHFEVKLSKVPIRTIIMDFWEVVKLWKLIQISNIFIKYFNGMGVGIFFLKVSLRFWHLGRRNQIISPPLIVRNIIFNLKRVFYQRVDIK